jgi:hypothetical protein
MQHYYKLVDNLFLHHLSQEHHHQICITGEYSFTYTYNGVHYATYDTRIEANGNCYGFINIPFDDIDPLCNLQKAYYGLDKAKLHEFLSEVLTICTTLPQVKVCKEILRMLQ